LSSIEKRSRSGAGEAQRAKLLLEIPALVGDVLKRTGLHGRGRALDDRSEASCHVSVFAHHVERQVTTCRSRIWQQMTIIVDANFVTASTGILETIG
jgi:hypothetical protein